MKTDPTMTETTGEATGQKRLPYAAPKMVVLGHVRDLTLSAGSVAPDGKSGRGKTM